MSRLTMQEKIDVISRLHNVHESSDDVDFDVIQVQHDVDELLAKFYLLVPPGPLSRRKLTRQP